MDRYQKFANKIDDAAMAVWYKKRNSRIFMAIVLGFMLYTLKECYFIGKEHGFEDGYSTGFEEGQRDRSGVICDE